MTVTVGDTTAPIISQCASNQSANADANCQAAVPDFRSGVVANDNCTATGSLVVTQSPPVGAFVGLGPTPITLTVTDAANNSANCAATFTVNDLTLPTFANCPANIGPVPTDAGLATASVNWTPPTASDNCSTPSVGTTHSPGFAFPIGTTSVTYTATDGAGNIQTCSFSVTVQDIEAPSIQNCPGTITLSAETGTCSAIASWTEPTVIDNAPGATISQIAGPASGASFPVGSTTIRYSAMDAAGNTAMCEFDVIVADDETPAFAGCPDNISIGTAAPDCEASVTWTAPSASDNCGIAGVSSSHDSGDTFPLGTTPVLYTATDVNGRQAMCSFNVTVVDDDAPTIQTCASDQEGAPDENCQAAVPDFTTGVVSSDNCTPAGSLVITQSPTVGTLVGAPTTITISIADAAGNIATCEATFTVTNADAILPTITTCAEDQQVSLNANCQASVPDFTAGVVATDNCTPVGSLVITQNPSAGTLVGGGSITVTISVADGAGNIASCEATLTATDSALPTIDGCPSDLTVNSNAPNCSAVVSWTEPTVSDNCPGAAIVQTEGPASGSLFANGSATTITYTATDAANQAATCSFTVTVNASADVNDDGFVDMNDIAPFVGVLIDVNTNVPDIYRADVNCDGQVDGRDIEPFTALLVGP
ncbi:MAG: HYR domain-containing protein [Planctomycetes bacterium]|nr:HYR domain-containing protein [Planctomycetota bacterium]